MKTLKWLLAGVLLGLIAVAFRDFERKRWLLPAGHSSEPPWEPEPILGYDGMDQETLLEWLEAARPDMPTLERMYRYEQANHRREPVLSDLAELLG